MSRLSKEGIIGVKTVVKFYLINEGISGNI